MPRCRRTNRAGNRRIANGGTAIQFLALGKPSQKSPVRTNIKKDQETRECPTCKTQIQVLKDGNLGSHRVGRGLNSWLCKGEDKGVYSQKSQ